MYADGSLYWHVRSYPTWRRELEDMSPDEVAQLDGALNPLYHLEGWVGAPDRIIELEGERDGSTSNLNVPR